jgi:GNAT superfamily N-acetyltransferase
MSSPCVPAVAGTTVHPADRPRLRLPAVLLRPLAPGDTGTIVRVIAGLSAESRRLRFLAPLPRLGDRFLCRLADVDHDRHGCWVAVVAGVPVGLGRYVQLPTEAGVAEVAMEVVDEIQGRGLGSLLLDAVSVAAADAGVRQLLLMTDPANVRVQRLARRLGAHFSVDGGVLSARTGLPVVRNLDTGEIVRLARSARAAAADPTAAP